jgi:aromatic-L-amino-acid decarboxylase
MSPALNPEEFRSNGHRLIDLLADYLATVEGRPLFPRTTPSALERLFDEPLPLRGKPLDRVLDEIEEKVLPNSVHVNHPGYLGYITPSPNPVGILGDLVASALNQNPAAWNIGPAATTIERRTVRWLCDLIGFGPAAGGNLTSGGTTANFLGVKLARDFATRDRAQHEGLSERLVVYASEERHVSNDKAVDAVGIGRRHLRALPTDERFRLRLDALEDAIAADRAAGLHPACIVGMGGTTNTGSVDDVAALRRIADRHGMWLHVDAAYGGGCLLSPALRGVLSGLELADSVAIDPHKWFYAPLDAGALLVRDAARLTTSFGMKPPYLIDRADPDGERYDFFVHGFEQSRRSRALKVWMSFQRYGADELGRWVEANVAQARHLHAALEGDPELHSATEPVMSAVCVRYEPPGAAPDEPRSAALHARVARAVEASGRFWISTTALKGKTHFRINPVNLQTREEHMDELVALLRKECRAAR